MVEDVSVNEGMPTIFTGQVHLASANVTWFIDDERVTSDNQRYLLSVEGDERTLEVSNTSPLCTACLFLT